MDGNGPVGVVVMGVSGCGKSSLGAALATAEGWPFLEGDEFHPATNVARMRTGQPLDDADRAPWLAALATAIAEHLHAGRSVAASCSALKRSYRDTLRQAGPLRFIYLPVPPDELRRRMRERSHFMPPALLDSQLATLEEPAADEDALVLPPAPLEAMLAQARAWLDTNAPDHSRMLLPHRTP